MELLLESPDRVFTRTELLSRAWDINFDTHSNLVDVTIGRLKKKINWEPLKPMIEPVRGMGYRLRVTE